MGEANPFDTTLHLPSEREIVITRVFAAPRRLVFTAWTTPAHVARWYGPAGTTMRSCEIDLRPGGRWRYVVAAPGGEEYAFSGEYRVVAPPELLVYTEGFEGLPGHEALVTLRFDEADGRTTLTSTLLYQSAADRDGHISSGMEPGMRESLDRLAALLETFD